MIKQTYTKRSALPASAGAVFAWHEASGAFKKLTPPWEKVRVLRHTGGIRDGAEVILLVGPMPLCLRWDLTHVDYQAGRSFTDQQVNGPFKSWKHVHRMIPDGDQACVLEDHIEYELPMGWVGAMLGGWLMRRKLERLFRFRHAVTRQAFTGLA